eukprot:TRINITY_DN17268_c0_g1_i1.p1 TRINITY_DN17268_c0_g1~~TRINITY_DN17268_c0_g1_i1.p1  ORF type:complete len:100 (-),score=24.31 TRINITY_DN17268_c0_g1_i1:11-310(-)
MTWSHSARTQTSVSLRTTSKQRRKGKRQNRNRNRNRKKKRRSGGVLCVFSFSSISVLFSLSRKDVSRVHDKLKQENKKQERRGGRKKREDVFVVFVGGR